MSKSIIHNKYIRDENRRMNTEAGRYADALSERPVLRCPGKHIESRLHWTYDYIKSNISFGGHKRRHNASLLSGLMRMRLKRETMREITERMSEE